MSPIRDWTSLEACKDYADAVYFGLSGISMRSNAGTFTLRNMKERREKYDALNSGALDAIMAVDIPTKGVDIPNLRIGNGYRIEFGF